MKMHLMGRVMTGPPWYWKFTTGGLHGATVAPPLLLGLPMGRASGPFFLEWPASALVAGGTPTSAGRRLLRSNVGYFTCLASVGSKNKLIRNNGIRTTTVIMIFIDTEPRRRGIPAALTIFDRNPRRGSMDPQSSVALQVAALSHSKRTHPPYV